jgi:hypothetical protein
VNLPGYATFLFVGSQEWLRLQEVQPNPSATASASISYYGESGTIFKLQNDAFAGLDFLHKIFAAGDTSFPDHSAWLFGQRQLIEDTIDLDILDKDGAVSVQIVAQSTILVLVPA